MATPLYRHTQAGALIRWAVGSAVVLTVVIALVFASGTVSKGHALVPVLVGGLLVVLAYPFSSLTVEVSPRELIAYFGPGLIRKKVALSDIREVRAVRNRWWYGWGIRLTPHGWMYNVSGLDAVELELASGRRFRIGTDEPEELVQAIHSASGRAPDAPGSPGDATHSQ